MVHRAAKARLAYIHQQLVRAKHLDTHHNLRGHHAAQHGVEPHHVILPQGSGDGRQALLNRFPCIQMRVAQRLVTLVGHAECRCQGKHGQTDNHHPDQYAQCKDGVAVQNHGYFLAQMAEYAASKPSVASIPRLPVVLTSSVVTSMGLDCKPLGSTPAIARLSSSASW
jgi:hypothetical protein